ncbi:MAG: septal ring lytic transglycosylase RlpA family protein [Acidimicrobiales bacterium]
MLVGSVLSLGLLGVPLLLLSTGATLSAAPGGAGGGRAAATAAARAHMGLISSTKLAFEERDPSTTTAPVPAQVPAAPVITTTAAPVTTTTEPPPPPVTTTTVDANTATGVATWYSEAPPGRCASPWLPKGVTLTVTDIATGATITCLVDDREADNPGRIVDLSPSGFGALAPLGQGVIQVAISW